MGNLKFRVHDDGIISIYNVMYNKYTICAIHTSQQHFSMLFYIYIIHITNGSLCIIITKGSKWHIVMIVTLQFSLEIILIVMCPHYTK